MGAYDCWRSQKPKLREKIKDAGDEGSIAYAVRHALAQVEQSTMAEQTDDLLRQQTGILFGICKTSVHLLDVPVVAKVWALQSQKKENPQKTEAFFWIIAALSQIAAGLYAYAKGYLIVWMLMAAALVVAVIARAIGAKQRKRDGAKEDSLKVTVQVDEAKLFHALDMQMHAIDRHMHDFSYLNEQAADVKRLPDGKIVTLAADMVEALYESDGELREAAEEAANRMLVGLGLAAIPYSQGDQGLFTVLPSKTETRTMIPAIVSADDHRLLRRGVAAVRAGEAAG